MYLDVENPFDGRVADGLSGRQQAPARGDDAGEILSRLWRFHADPGRGLRRAQRAVGYRSAQPRAVSKAPRRDGRKLWPRRLGYSQPARVDVRLGAAAARAERDGQPGIFQAAFDPRDRKSVV